MNSRTTRADLTTADKRVEHLDLVEDRSPRFHRLLGDQAHLGRGIGLSCDDLSSALSETSDAFAEQHTKAPQEPPKFIIDPDARAHKHLAP